MADMFDRLSRRQFLKGSAAAGALGIALGAPHEIWPCAAAPGEPDFPVVDFHAHCFEESVPLAKLVEDAAQRGIANAQRVRNRQPDGGSIGFGGSPDSGGRSRR